MKGNGQNLSSNMDSAGILNLRQRSERTLDHQINSTEAWIAYEGSYGVGGGGVEAVAAAAAAAAKGSGGGGGRQAAAA